MTDQNSAPNQSNPFHQTQGVNSYVDTYQPPTMNDPAQAAPPAPAAPVAPQTSFMDDVSAPTSASAPAEPAGVPTKMSQTLEDQNIFHLLGVEGSEQEKESFLDELQQVIWEDFLDRDTEMLLTEDEMAGMKTILAKKDISAEQQQEEVLVYLDKLIPDLEAIMLEKALELKEDMVRERLAGMKEFYAGNQEVLSKLTQAEELMNDAQWRDAADLLNGIK